MEKLRFPVRGATFLIAIACIYSIAITFITPIYPSFVKSIVKSPEYVGIVVSLVSAFYLLNKLFLSRLLRVIKKQTLFRLSLIGMAIIIFFYTFIKTAQALILIELLKSVFLGSIITTMALYIRHSATRKNIGDTEGRYFFFVNIVWLIGPIVGGCLATKYGFNAVFYTVSLIYILTFIVFSLGKREKEKFESDNHTIFQNLVSYFKDRQLLLIYLVSFGTTSWTVFLYTFVPLFLLSRNIPESIIGIVLGLAVIPLLLFEIPIGKAADRKGCRNLIFFGFFVITIALFASLFTDNIYFIIALVILAALGQAFLEPLRETYFFKITKKKDGTRYYPVNRTAIELSGIISPLLLSGILAVSNFKFVFLATAFIAGAFSLISLKLKE